MNGGKGSEIGTDSSTPIHQRERTHVRAGAHSAKTELRESHALSRHRVVSLLTCAMPKGRGVSPALHISITNTKGNSPYGE